MYLRFLTVFCIFSLFAGNCFAQACVGGVDTSGNQTTPTGLTNFFVLSSEESFNAPSFSTFDVVANPSIDGDRFDIDKMGRSVAAQIVQRQLAVDYFVNQFGVNFSTTVNADTNHTQKSWVSNDGKWKMYHFTIEPRYNQRIVYSGGEYVPTDGWKVNQGFYRMMAESGNNTASTTGAWGELVTRTVLDSTFADFGEMRIEQRLPCVTSGFQTSNIDLNYESIRPTFLDVLSRFGSSYGYLGNRANIDYNIYKESTALTGKARGRVELKSFGSNNYTAQVRIVLKLS